MAHLFSEVPVTRTDARALPEATTLSGAVAVFLRFATPRILLGSLIGWGGVRVAVGGFGPGDLAVALGIVVYWPLQEWFAHAFVLHLRPRRVLGWPVDPLFARVHRWHHRHPHVIERIFVPWQVIVALTPINAGLWWAAMPSSQLALTGAALFTAAALLYEWVHFSAHAPRAPRSAWLRHVRRNHALHHFKNEHYWHAFTVPWLDRWLGTDPGVADVPTSPTVRTLGVPTQGIDDPA